MNNLPYNVYCLCFNNEIKKANIKRIFNSVNIDCNINNGVQLNDPRIGKHLKDDGLKRILSCSYGHLEMVKDFYYNSNKDFGIFCEDDIYIHKDLISILENACIDFKKLNLDVLLLGYLTTFKIEYSTNEFPLLLENKDNNNPYKIFGFPDYLWGAQMYMISRQHAKFLIDKYSEDYVDKTVYDSSYTPFSPDWVFTKEGKRALISPMIAIEDGKSQSDDYVHSSFHANCFKTHYDEKIFIK
jgi:GR25 family glycosyltransferase involved in LPS biosynthesis